MRLKLITRGRQPLNGFLPVLFCLLFAGCLSTAEPGPGRAWFVSTSGCDDNPGTVEEPFLTINRAAEVAGPGDTVRVGPGVYAEAVVFPRSGEPDRPIVFAGERGPDGEWLTVLDRGVPLAGWEPAPEVGEGVFRAETGSAPVTVTLGGRMLARINESHMASGLGFRYLAMPAGAVLAGNEEVPADIRMENHLVPEHLFWDGIEALYGFHEGKTYIRFREGDDPRGMVLVSAESVGPRRNWPVPGTGGGFTIHDRGHIVIRDFCVRSAEVSVHLHGPGAVGNLVERNRLRHGRMRVLISGGASRNVVRDNEMSLAYHGHDRPGAWGTPDPDRDSSLAGYVYRVFKHIVGVNSSDDRAIALRGGDDNEITGNRIRDGLIGISVADASRAVISGNEISGMSSIGLHLVPAGGEGPVDCRFQDNLVYNCNINLRLHHFNAAAPGRWRTWFFRNVFLQPENRGHHVYVHWVGDEGPGVLPDRGHPEVFFYHNTFSGGTRVLTPGRVRPGGGLPLTRFFNNVLSSPVAVSGAGFRAAGREVIDVFDRNLVVEEVIERPAWFGEENIVDPGARLSRPDGSPGIRLAEDSPARGAGLDLSRPFSVQGRDFPALPGMEPGYFTGDAPDLGAIPFGASVPFEKPALSGR